MNLSTLCKEDEDLWMMRCPLICFYAVEYHLPHHVARLFGRLQPCPPDDFSTLAVAQVCSPHIVIFIALYHFLMIRGNIAG